MITQLEKDTILTQYAGFIQQTIDFKALVATNGLPVTSHLPTLETAFKSQIFQKLLAVDKGLKMRFELLKTDEARVKLIDAHVDIDGYEDVATMRNVLLVLEQQYNRISLGVMHGRLFNLVPFDVFTDHYKMDLEALVSGFVFDWTGKEDVLEYVQGLAPALEQLRTVFRAVHSTSVTLADTLRTVAMYFTDESNTGPIEVKESAVMTNLVRLLDQHDARHLVAATTK